MTWFGKQRSRVGQSIFGSAQPTARPLYNAADLHRAVAAQRADGAEPVGHRFDFAEDCERVANSFALRRLQSKTQLFPVRQNDFVRTRLTHSVEVAHVAKRIALRLNTTTKELEGNPIDLDLVHAAALCHDIGHPPFGHTGERTLNHCMRSWGGFEGNAQSLRLLTRLEHSAADISHRQSRSGLNLTSRTLASSVKYDQELPKTIPQSEGPDKSDLIKGYFPEERDIVDRLKADVLGRGRASHQLLTVEAQIMDMADDIAYSTFDLEDSFRIGYVQPFDFISSADEFLSIVADHVSNAARETLTVGDVRTVLRTVLNDVFKILGTNDPFSMANRSSDFIDAAVRIQNASRELASSASFRSAFTSQLISNATSAIALQYDSGCPALSKVIMPRDARLRIEVLKAFVYFSVTQSPEIQIARFKARHIISAIFDALTSSDGLRLLPRDRRAAIENLPTEQRQKRAVCDFIADMTDTYATEFYGRLMSTDGETIYKPV